MLHRLARRLIGLVCAGWLGASAVVAVAAPTVTIVDGEAVIVDGARSLAATEGQRLGEEALVRTDARTRLLRLEWPDGTAADIGPDTQAMVGPGGLARGGKPPVLYLLRGWAKLSSPATAETGGLIAPRLDVQPFKGTLVVMSAADESWVFAETGTAVLADREPKAGVATLKSGEVYLRTGAAKGTVSPRPTPAQMQRVPKGFRDALPLRLQALKDKPQAARGLAPPTYADLAAWLAAEKPLRRNFTRRFAERARDPAFRSGLADHLAAHPEWEPVLFPERFQPKPASAPR